MANDKIFEVHYFDTYNTGFCYEGDIELFKSFDGYAKMEQIKECRSCGDETEELELVNNHPRCKDCAEKSRAAQQRANEYMYSGSEEEDYDF